MLPQLDRDGPGSRGPRLTALVTLLFTGAALPFAGRMLGDAPSFLPALLAVIGCFDLLSVALLLGEFKDDGDRRLLVMSAAYGWSLVTMLGYAFAFPGVIAPHAPLAITLSMAPWLYIAWHGGFPVLIGLAWAPMPTRWTLPVARARRRNFARFTISIAVLSGIATVAGLTAAAHSLPELIHGLDTSAMTRLTAPWTVPLTALALISASRGTRGRNGPERWAPVVVVVCLADLALTYTAEHRFSVGWYAGRTLTLVAAGLVVLATIATLRRAKGRAQHDALYDSLTELANRRSAYADLELLVAVARRTATPLAVVTFDIDHFKQINDLHGHDRGDLVLQTLGRALPGWLRTSDIAARVGGEEFLLVLPDTGTAGAQHLAEVVRTRVTTLPGLPFTVSLGVGELQPGDTAKELLRRADQALYEAKHNGRNRTATIPGQRTPNVEHGAATGSARSALNTTAPQHAFTADDRKGTIPGGATGSP